MSAYYPLYLNLAGRTCVVIGGGPVAERKVNGLLESKARVRVITIEATSKLKALAERGTIDLRLAAYSENHLMDAVLVFAATGDRSVNARVAEDAAKHRIWVNVADAPEEGEFIVPSVLRRGELCISVSTGGNQPLLASRIAADLQTRFGPEYGDFLDLLGRMRADIKARTGDLAARRAALEALLDAETDLRSLLAAGEVAAAQQMAQQIIGRALNEKDEG